MTLHTLAAPVEHAVEIKHSRFIARATPVETPEAALVWLEQVAVPDATHNCWAWRIGDDYRSSDDGEPAGTAGRPILAAIDGQGLDRVVVVVTRWYGGIKLGAGGLVRAYGGAAAEALRTAPRLPLIEVRELWLQAGFEDIGAAHAVLAACGADKLEEQFDSDGVHMRLQLPTDAIDALVERLRDATRDRARLLEEAPAANS
ncbi:MAG: YigZ family protein [Pseudoxanthomonas suwonensis]|nr:YigZ family protein [Pseudoxanthomonas suwonensis]